MFNRLISNLPFHPSLISQVAFYTKRLRQEESIRRWGFVCIALTMAVQMFAVIAPPQPSYALDKDNDILPGGFSSQAEAVNHCNQNNYNFAKVLNYSEFGITCQDIASGKVETIGSRDYDSSLLSMGRKPYAKPGEYAIQVSGAGTFYMRPLWSWDGASTTQYKAIVGKTARGTVFMVLFNCGNITIVKKNPTTKPVLKTIRCDGLVTSFTAGSRLKRGATVKLQAKATGNNTPEGEAVDFSYEYIDMAKNTPVSPPHINSRGVPLVKAMATDPKSQTYILDKPGHYAFRATVTYDGGIKIAEGSATGACMRDVFVDTPPTDICPLKQGLQVDRAECDVCPDVEGVQEQSAACKPCDHTSVGGTTCLILSKSAQNKTQRLTKADGSLARAGDTITYTLSAKNTGGTTMPDFTIEENISDVLDYADVVDYHGGIQDSAHIVRWPAVAIKGGQTESKELTIKIKNPIPQTPTSASNPGKFDLEMTNVYGNAIHIRLPASTAKATEQITTTLPNTGPGANLFLAFTLMSIAGYFFARNHLLVKELNIVKADYAAGA